MTKKEALALLANGSAHIWNDYRERHPNWLPDLSGLDISELVLAPLNAEPFDLSGANLCGTKLPPSTHFFNSKGAANLNNALFDINTECPFNLIDLGATFTTEEDHSAADSARQKTVFISYAWANQDVVLAIDQWLRHKGLDVKIDRRDFFAGARIRDEVLRLMHKSSIVLIFYSQESKDKAWTVFEQELAADLEMAAKQQGHPPPRIVYIVIDDTPLPDLLRASKLVIMARGKKFRSVCEEVYRHVLEIPALPEELDLSQWDDYVF